MPLVERCTVSGIFTNVFSDSSDMFTEAGMLVTEDYKAEYFTHILYLFVWTGATIRDTSVTDSQLPRDPKINFDI